MAKLKGRPRGSGHIKKPEQKATVPAKLSPYLVEILESEQKQNESFSDTIVRLLREKTSRLQSMQKNLNALQQKYEQLASLYEGRLGRETIAHTNNHGGS